eukprot:UN05325
MPCGHVCPRLCHPSDMKHVLGVKRCNKPCTFVHKECGHKCTKRCGECDIRTKCGKCQFKIEKKLSCGHKKMMSCWEKPSDVVCTKILEKVVVCENDHATKEPIIPKYEQRINHDFKCGHSRKIQCWKFNNPLFPLRCNKNMQEEIGMFSYLCTTVFLNAKKDR